MVTVPSVSVNLMNDLRADEVRGTDHESYYELTRGAIAHIIMPGCLLSVRHYGETKIRGRYV